MIWLAKLARRLAQAHLASLLLLTPMLARAQISPGPLAEPHAQFKGATNCVKCHGLQREPMTQMCLACHKEIQALRTAQQGFHGGNAKVARTDCARCHPDHAGGSFSLIAWDEGTAERFDHRRAGWALEGKHADAKCDACHAAKFRTSPIAALSPRKSIAGWVGLDRACASCHRVDDVHKGSLGATCDRCHDAKGWKPAPAFDHELTAYALKGKHADVACDKCHRIARLSPQLDAKGIRPAVYKPVPHRECSACHDDPHKGRLSSACGDCHVTTSFATIDRRGFNHSLTRYPLDGRHRDARCETCHGEKMQQRNPPFATCGSCHADAHRGEATLGGKPADCASCHNVRGFSPSTFTLVQHAATRFALHGRHTDVRCAQCHTPATPATPATSTTAAQKQVRIRVAFARCDACHADAHGGQLASRAAAGSCEACHGDEGWKPSTFGIAQHARLKLALDGRHAALACAACHGLVRPGLPPLARTAAALGTAKVALTIDETGCASCHADPHRGRYSPGGAFALSGGCSACHGTQAFRPAVMDAGVHTFFAFALEGAHRATPCVACHEEMRVPAAPRTLVLDAKGLASLPYTAQWRTSCTSCHDSPHGTQFAARAGNGTCEGCHAAAAWAPASRFDHERDATFSLKGAHARVPCASCHRRPQGAGASAPVAYRGVPSKCEACHDARRAGGVH